MEYIRLGSTGLKVSRLCLGCMTYGAPGWRPWVLDEAASQPFFDQAFDLGINFFDTADMYSLGISEEITGQALKVRARRHEYVLATKVYNPMGPGPNERGLSRKHVMEAIDSSLRRLGTDYIDLWQIHRLDHDTPMEEALEALNDVVRAGKVLYLGASSMYAWQFMKALGIQRQHGWAPFVSMQNHVNLLYREEEREMLPLCASEGIAVIPWSPMARGRLAHPVGDLSTARQQSDDIARGLYVETAASAIIGAVQDIAERRNVSMAQIALAWVLSKQGITAPIVGASKPHHLADAVAALSLRLSPDEIKQLETHYRHQPVRGHA